MLEPNDAQLGDSLGNLGFLYFQMGRLEESEALYLRAIQIEEIARGSDHPGVAVGLFNLGNVYADAGRHPRGVASSKAYLSQVYLKLGRLDEAERLMREALAVWEGALEEDHYYRVQGDWYLANILRDQGRYEEATPLYQRVVSLWQQERSADNPYLRRLVADYAALLRRMGLDEQADALASSGRE